MVLVAPLWNEELCPLHLPVQFKWHDYLFCLTAEPLPYFYNSLQQQILVCLLKLSFVFVGKRLVNRAVRHVHIVDESILTVVVIVNAEHVNVCYRVAHHLAFCAELVDKHILLLQFFSLFKLHSLCALHHLVIYNLA